MKRIEMIGRNAFESEWIRVATMALLLLLCVGGTWYFHFVRGIDVVFTHFFYVPIILAGFWWCKRAVWVALFLGVCLVGLRILSGGGISVLPCICRSVMFVVVGAVAGFLRNRCQMAEERELRRTRDFLDKLLNYSNAPIIVWDPSFAITRFNHAFELLTGLKAGDVVGEPLDILFPDDRRDEAMAHIRRAVAGERWEVVEIAIMRVDGKVRVVLWNSANIYTDDDTTLLATIAQGTDITERKQAEDEVRSSLREKEVLLKEIHHRVKNNLQVISSLLSLQLAQVNDKQAVELFREGRDRVRSMAFIHEELYRDKHLSHVDFPGYVRTLTSSLFRSYGVNSSTVALEIDTSDVMLGIDTAIPCGLIVNELVSNSLKHAFPEGRKGKIRVSLRAESNGKFVLVIHDDGIGLPLDVDSRNAQSLGLQLVYTLTEQIEGTIELNREHGTEFRIVFTENAPIKI